ncbi:MAG: acyltransferase family protein [Nitriliruptoraceae bacterium]|nr:acyltransferase family protein [Nitriliruptoraceae bacterium]
MSAGPQAEIISIEDARDARAGAAGRTRCAATTTSGASCRNYAVDGPHCRIHAARRGDAEPDAPATTDSASGGADAAAADPGPDAGPTPRGPRSGGAGERSRPHERDRAGADRRTGRASLFSDPSAFEDAARELRGRGYPGAVDGLAVLRERAEDAWPDAVRGLVAFLRRRLTGDYEIDAFGFDEDLTTNVLMPLLRPLHQHYWRVSSHGVEHIPTDDGALLVANHAGTLPADALITRLDVFDRTGRHARELGADLVFRTPFVGELARKTGATLASGDDADRLLASGELVAVWPEGYKGLGKHWRDRYKLQRFGRGGFVATALRAEVPIVPTAIVGSEEIYPLLFDLRIVARVLGVPYFPVVAQMLALPVLGPFALLPLPSKWLIEYGEPIETASLGPGLADDPMALFDLTDQVRDRIQGMLHRNLMGRRSVFL